MQAFRIGSVGFLKEIMAHVDILSMFGSDDDKITMLVNCLRCRFETISLLLECGFGEYVRCTTEKYPASVFEIIFRIKSYEDFQRAYEKYEEEFQFIKEPCEY